MFRHYINSTNISLVYNYRVYFISLWAPDSLTQQEAELWCPSSPKTSRTIIRTRSPFNPQSFPTVY